jgi:hypothetical protein
LSSLHLFILLLQNSQKQQKLRNFVRSIQRLGGRSVRVSELSFVVLVPQNGIQQTKQSQSVSHEGSRSRSSQSMNATFQNCSYSAPRLEPGSNRQTLQDIQKNMTKAKKAQWMKERD